METIHAESIRRQEYLEGRIHEVTAIWEQEYDDRVKYDSNFKTFVRTVKVSTTIILPDAFYGGKTNAAKLHYSASKDEKIYYYIVRNEFPFNNRTKTYPLGHPTIVTKNFQNPRQFFGLMCCTILPPKLVVPCRSNKELTFPLFQTCVNSYNNAPCQHADE